MKRERLCSQRRQSAADGEVAVIMTACQRKGEYSNARTCNPKLRGGGTDSVNAHGPTAKSQPTIGKKHDADSENAVEKIGRGPSKSRKH